MVWLPITGAQVPALARIAVQVVGSWIAAIGLFILGWAVPGG
jgi:hypothetical protein